MIVTGADLVEELRAGAKRNGVSLAKFAMPLTSARNSHAFLTQLKMAKLPTPLMIERVRALCEGRPIPAHRGARFRQVKNGIRHCAEHSEARVPGEVIEHRRRLTEAAHESRLPGETIASAVRRLSRQHEIIADMEGAP